MSNLRIEFSSTELKDKFVEWFLSSGLETFSEHNLDINGKEVIGEEITDFEIYLEEVENNLEIND